MRRGSRFPDDRSPQLVVQLVQLGGVCTEDPCSLPDLDALSPVASGLLDPPGHNDEADDVGDRTGKERGRSQQLRQPEHGNESFVDPPHLFVGEMAHEVSEPLSIDRAELLHEYSRDVPRDMRLRPKRRRTGTPRGRSNDDDRSRKKLVRLENHAVAFAVLFVTSATRQPEPVDVTAQHAKPP